MMYTEGSTSEESKETYGSNSANVAESEANLAYEPFDPVVEIAAIRDERALLANLPEDQKQEQREFLKLKIAEFREKWLNQKEALAQVIELVYKEVTENPGVEVSQLLTVIEDASVQGFFTQSQKELLRSGIENLSTDRALISSYRELYTDDTDLFNRLFGFAPQGEVSIIPGTVSIAVAVYDREDALAIARQSRTKEGEMTLDQIEEDVAALIDGAIGFVVYKTEVSELDEQVFVLNYTDSSVERLDADEEAWLRRHEEQHVWDIFYTPYTKEYSTETEELPLEEGEWEQDVPKLMDEEITPLLWDETLAQFSEDKTEESLIDAVRGYIRPFITHFVHSSDTMLRERYTVSARLREEEFTRSKESFSKAVMQQYRPYWSSVKNRIEALYRIKHLCGSIEAALPYVYTERMENWPLLAKQLEISRRHKAKMA